MPPPRIRRASKGPKGAFFSLGWGFSGHLSSGKIMTTAADSVSKDKATRAVRMAIIVAALGYFVDIYDLVLFSIVRVKSLQGIGITEPQALLEQGVLLINMQMGGMLVGGILWGHHWR
jgi:hypothetical protein